MWINKGNWISSPPLAPPQGKIMFNWTNNHLGLSISLLNRPLRSGLNEFVEDERWSISAGSFIALISKSNAVGSRKNEPVSWHVIDAMFFYRWLLSVVPSLPQPLFSVMPFCESRGLFYVCVSVFFSSHKINSMHISYMYKRCKMFVLYDLYRNRSLNVILKKFENALLSLLLMKVK